LVCATCGRDNPETSAFFAGCGARLSPADATPAQPAPAQPGSIPGQLLRGWLPVAYLVLVGYFDYMSHREWVPLRPQPTYYFDDEGVISGVAY